MESCLRTEAELYGLTKTKLEFRFRVDIILADQLVAFIHSALASKDLKAATAPTPQLITFC